MDTRQLLRLGKRSIKRSLLPLCVPWVTSQQLVRSLRSLGIREDSSLLVHSSLSRLGYVPGGTSAVISALLECVGERGTLVMPSHTWEAVSAGQRVLDLRTAPGCVGAIAESFRALSGVARSLHPTHSVAGRGPRQIDLTAGHETCEAPCGAGSPYAKLIGESGQILLLGVGGDSNTCFHTAEALADVPYLMNSSFEQFTLIDDTGTPRRLSFQMHRPFIKCRFQAEMNTLVARGIAVTGKSGNAQTILMDGNSFLEHLLGALATDPLYLLGPGSSRRLGETAFGRLSNPLSDVSWQRYCLSAPISRRSRRVVHSVCSASRSIFPDSGGAQRSWPARRCGGSQMTRCSRPKFRLTRR